METLTLVALYISTRDIYKTIKRCGVISEQNKKFVTNRACDGIEFIQNHEYYQIISSTINNFGNTLYSYLQPIDDSITSIVRYVGTYVADITEPVIGKDYSEIIRYRTDFEHTGLLTFNTIAETTFHTDIVRVIGFCLTVKPYHNSLSAVTLITMITSFKGAYQEDLLGRQFKKASYTLKKCNQNTCTKKEVIETLNDTKPSSIAQILDLEMIYTPIVEKIANFLTQGNIEFPLNEIARYATLAPYVQSIIDMHNTNREELEKVAATLTSTPYETATASDSYYIGDSYITTNNSLMGNECDATTVLNNYNPFDDILWGELQ